MASLKDAAAVTEQLEELAGQLHAELTEGRTDFGEMARLADEIGESADSIAAAFIAIDEALARRLAESRGATAAQRGSQKTRAGDEKVETGDSTDQAIRAGREKTSDSAAAASASVKREGDDTSSPLAELSREDLLERARDLEIAGRSRMSKEELLSTIQSEEQVSKEELLERAKEAGIPGRSTMTKEELADAVRSEESLSRDELLERAREADIPGRSDMSKEELREALSSE